MDNLVMSLAIGRTTGNMIMNHIMEIEIQTLLSK